MPREKRQTARQTKHQDFSDSDEESEETMVKSPPKKAKKNSIPRYLEERSQAEIGAIMTPVIKTSNATTQPLPTPMMHAPVVLEVPVQSYPCGTCHNEVSDNDDAIFCESGCSQWYHRLCAGLTERAYDLLTNEENADWVCDQCIAKKNIPLVKLKS